MPIHITWYDMKSPEKDPDGSAKTIIERTLNSKTQAYAFISHLKFMIGFNKKTYEEMFDVVKATDREYVGTEHDLQMGDGTWHQRYGISIEGTLKPNASFPTNPKPSRYFYLESLTQNGPSSYILRGQMNGEELIASVGVPPDGFRIIN